MYRLFWFLSVLYFVQSWGSFRKVGPQSRSRHVDPECYMDSPQLIADNGFVPETHFVTTKDGYILQIFRVKPNTGRYKIVKSLTLTNYS